MAGACHDAMHLTERHRREINGNNMLNGIIPVLLTPMLEDYSIDNNGMKSLMKHLHSSGIESIWALGSASGNKYRFR